MLVTAVFLTLVTVQIPLPVAGTDGDASWSSVLNYAHQQGWQFGTDIVYTYGPLGFLTSHHYSLQALGFQMATKTALAFSVALGVCLVAWRLPMFWKWALIGIFYFFSGGIYNPGTAYAATDLSTYTGLLCWGVLCIMGPRRHLMARCLCFVALAVLGTLVKVSLILPAALGVGAIALSLVIRGRRRLGPAMVIAYGLGVIACWLAVGQKLAQFGAFLHQGFEIARGYHDAMGFEINRTVMWTSVATGLLALSTLAIPFAKALTRLEKKAAWSRLVLCLWLCCLFFVVWKYGMVQSGQAQLEIFIGFMPVLALSMILLAPPHSARATWLRGIALATTIMSLILLDTTFYRGFTCFCLCQPFNLLPWNMHCLLKPADYWTRPKPPVPLPKTRALVGRASIDVFDSQQGYALLSGLNYRPRPVFQSFAAYSAPLTRLNESFYLSAAAPKYVLFALSVTGGKFPPLQDSMVLRDLLINYRPVETERDFILLQCRGTSTPKLTPVREGAAHPGERILLPAESRAALWMDISLEPTLAGNLLRLAYKFPPVALSVWRDEAEEKPETFLAPQPMLSAGFLASPLIRDNKDVKDLYNGSPPARPVAYSVELPPGTEKFWQSAIHFRIYKIENQLGGPCAAPPHQRLSAKN